MFRMTKVEEMEKHRKNKMWAAEMKTILSVDVKTIREEFGQK